jgi:hypothetical protein
VIGPSHKNLYQTTHIIQEKLTFMPSVGFEPAIPVSERPQTFVLDSAATEIVKFQLQADILKAVMNRCFV